MKRYDASFVPARSGREAFFRWTGAMLAALGLLTLARSASAQEVQVTGPLKGAAAVRGLRLYREGRVELAPTVSFTFLDEYRRTMLVGARLTYNIKDWIGIGAWGGFAALSDTTDLTDQIDASSPRNGFTSTNVGRAFADQTAKMSWVAAPQVTFVPFRGKLAVFQSLFIDTDLYLSAGVAFVGLQERGDCDNKTTLCSSAASFELKSRMAVAPTFGLGVTFYAANFVSFGLEYRALPFSWNRSGFDQRGSGTNGNFPDGKVDSQDQTFKWNQMITVAIGFSLPAKPAVKP
ncbi:MAG: hypothetical protein WCI05_14740 [Myxococcales bacterium]